MQAKVVHKNGILAETGIRQTLLAFRVKASSGKKVPRMSLAAVGDAHPLPVRKASGTPARRTGSWEWTQMPQWKPAHAPTGGPLD